MGKLDFHFETGQRENWIDESSSS